MLTIDLFREISKTRGRFISIFFIVLLGTAFFIGLRLAGKDMRISMKEYYQKTNFMDFEIISTLGITKSGIEELKQIKGVQDVVGQKTYDAKIKGEKTQNIARVMGITPSINEPYLVSGRLPKNKKECLLDNKFSKKYKIGNVIELINEDIKSKLSEDKFEIVGFCNLPKYTENDRGLTKLGNGVVDAFILTKIEIFKEEVYSSAYVKIDTKEDTYGKEYEEISKKIKEDLLDVGSIITKKRYAEIRKVAESKIKSAERRLKKAKNRIKKEGKRLITAKNELKDKKKELEALLKNRDSLLLMGAKDMVKRLDDTSLSLEIAEKKLEKAEIKYRRESKKALLKLDRVKSKIEKKKKFLNKIKDYEVYVFDRCMFAGFVNFKQNAERMDNLSIIFPSLFFLVAVLVSLTAMTRMVDEDRTAMGVLKALGFNSIEISYKYMTYAIFASLVGGAFGVLIGSKFLPHLIISSYQTMFTGLPYALTPFHLKDSIITVLIAMFSTMMGCIIAIFSNLRQMPGALLRPLPPKTSNRILIEKLPFVWNRLKFTEKIIFRNITRYKKRLIMTVIGIAGCMGLLIVGFGLYDSIKEIDKRQYVEIFRHRMSVSLNEKLKNAERDKLLKRVEKILASSDVLELRSENIEAKNGNTEKKLLLLAGDYSKSSLICFMDRTSKREYESQFDGAYITEKSAKLLSLKKGDKLSLSMDGNELGSLEIKEIVENYLSDYIFISEKTYEQIFKKKYRVNTAYFSYGEDVDEKLASENLLKIKEISGIELVSDAESRIKSMLEVLTAVIIVLIISAGLLAFVVLYNLNSINIIERKREIATLKVLGFEDIEVAGQVFKETMVLTLLGIIIGIFFGRLLHSYVIETVEVDFMMFGRIISINSYFYSVLLTLVFVGIVDIAMYFTIRNINMTESLKSIE